MEHAQPPFFRTGPTPLVRLLLFTAISLALLVADQRMRYLDVLREAASVVVYPAQRIAGAPASIYRRASDFFVTNASLRTDNVRLERENLANSALVQQLASLESENEHLRKLLVTRERIKPRTTVVEILYAARDPFSRKLVVDQGSTHEVRAGQPVIDGLGVIGQVTRVYPLVSEVTLITDKDHLVPVLNTRNGLRAVLAGTGNDGALELRFVPLNADFENGDPLVTSGIDGVYPPGLPVAQVSNVERNAAFLFARITCKPVGGVNNHRQVLVVHAQQPVAERPPDVQPAPARGSKKGKRGG